MTSYDDKFNASKHIKFYPYIGSMYMQANPKILILGHSHYADCDGSQDEIEKWNSDKNRTRDVIMDDYLATLEGNGGKTHPYSWVRCYRKMAATLTGEPYHCSDYIWKKLAFSNFFQKHAGIGPHDRQFCTAELLNSSRIALWENLQILQPNYVIVWGSELVYNCLPSQGFVGITHKDMSDVDDTSPWIGYYQDFPAIIFWWMKHPSSPSFSYNLEHQNWKIILEMSNVTE